MISLPFSEIYEHQRPKQHAVELAAVAQLAQTLLDVAVDSDIDPNMVREFAHQGFGFRNSGGLRRIECYSDSDFRRGP